MEKIIMEKLIEVNGIKCEFTTEKINKINGVKCEFDIHTLTQDEAIKLGIGVDRCPLCGEIANLEYDKINNVWSSCKCKECSAIIWTTMDIDIYGIDACIEGVDISKYDCSTHTQEEYLKERMEWRNKMFPRDNGVLEVENIGF